VPERQIEQIGNDEGLADIAREFPLRVQEWLTLCCACYPCDRCVAAVCLFHRRNREGHRGLLCGRDLQSQSPRARRPTVRRRNGGFRHRNGENGTGTRKTTGKMGTRGKTGPGKTGEKTGTFYFSRNVECLCFSLELLTNDDKHPTVAVLKLPHVNQAQVAVRAAILAATKKGGKQ